MIAGIDGGQTQKLAENLDRTLLAISPDGKSLLVRQWGQTPTSPSKLSVVSAENGEMQYSFDAPPGMGVYSWSPDGHALDYVLLRGGVGNLWEQPLPSGAPKQITNYRSDLTRDFDWSKDGKQMVLVRGYLNGNVMLISNFH